MASPWLCLISLREPPVPTSHSAGVTVTWDMSGLLGGYWRVEFRSCSLSKQLLQLSHLPILATTVLAMIFLWYWWEFLGWKGNNILFVKIQKSIIASSQSWISKEWQSWAIFMLWEFATNYSTKSKYHLTKFPASPNASSYHCSKTYEVWDLACSASGHWAHLGDAAISNTFVEDISQKENEIWKYGERKGYLQKKLINTTILHFANRCFIFFG